MNLDTSPFPIRWVVTYLGNDGLRRIFGGHSYRSTLDSAELAYESLVKVKRNNQKWVQEFPRDIQILPIPCWPGEATPFGFDIGYGDPISPGCPDLMTMEEARQYAVEFAEFRAKRPR